MTAAPAPAAARRSRAGGRARNGLPPRPGAGAPGIGKARSGATGRAAADAAGQAATGTAAATLTAGFAPAFTATLAAPDTASAAAGGRGPGADPLTVRAARGRLPPGRPRRPAVVIGPCVGRSGPAPPCAGAIGTVPPRAPGWPIRRLLAAALRALAGAAVATPARAAGRVGALVLTLLAGTAAGEEVRLRTGEHPGFTRIVVEVGPATRWRLGRAEGGYALDLDAPAGLALDLRGAFDRIPRTRVAALGYDPATGRLAIGLGCTACHARAFRHPRGWVVIDVADGPPPPGSPHEAPLPAAQAAPPPNDALPDWAGGGPLAPDSAQALPGPGTGGAAARLPSWIDSLVAPPLRPSADTGPAAAPRPSGSPGETAAPAAADRTADRTGSLAAAEALLARELARAASQGLVELALPLPPAPAEADAAPGPLPVPPDPPAGAVQLGAATSIDRDAGPPRPLAPVAAGGAACLPDAAFAVEDWGGDEPPAQGIARRRAALVGEFDAPDPEAVADLARFYLHLGLGAEAAATLAAFGADRPKERHLAAMAAALDGWPESVPAHPEARALLPAQDGCPGRAALWAVLAGAPPRGATDRRALVAAFSALPPGLRRHLGPGLGARYLEAGDAATAAAILDATLRAPGPAAAAADLLAARIDLAEAASDPAAAAARMRAAAAADDAIAPAAWAAALEAELGAGRLPPGAAETAAVLAVEAGAGPEGQRLARLSVRALLAAGDFAAARATLEAAARPPPTAFAAVAPDLWSDYAAALAAGADDAAFLIEAFAARDSLRPEALTDGARRALAARFADLGFPGEVLRLVPADAGEDADRLLRARGLLGTGAAAAAVGVLAGIEGPEADGLRARAFLALGDATSAAERFRRAGEAGAAARAAQAAGDWARLAREGEEGLAALARRLSDGVSSGDPGASGSTRAVAAPGAEAPDAPPGAAVSIGPGARQDAGAGAAPDAAAGAASGPAPAGAGDPRDPGSDADAGADADGPLAEARRALDEVSALRAALTAALGAGAAAAPP